MNWVIYTKNKGVQGGHWVEVKSYSDAQRQTLCDVVAALLILGNDRVMIAKEGDDGIESKPRGA